LKASGNPFAFFEQYSGLIIADKRSGLRAA